MTDFRLLAVDLDENLVYIKNEDNIKSRFGRWDSF